MPCNRDATTYSSWQAFQHVLQCQVVLSSAVCKAVQSTKQVSAAACRWLLTARSVGWGSTTPKESSNLFDWRSSVEHCPDG